MHENLNNKIGENAEKKWQTFLAFKTCSLLVGSIPNPVQETKIKSVSSPVCEELIIKLHSSMIKTIFIGQLNLISNTASEVSIQLVIKHRVKSILPPTFWALCTSLP